MILQVTDSGELILPAELVQAPPRTPLEAERHGETVTVKPVSPTIEHEESAALWETFPSFPVGVADPSMTFRREDLYGDEGR